VISHAVALPSSQFTPQLLKVRQTGLAVDNGFTVDHGGMGLQFDAAMDEN